VNSADHHLFEEQGSGSDLSLAAPGGQLIHGRAFNPAPIDHRRGLLANRRVPSIRFLADARQHFGIARHRNSAGIEDDLCGVGNLLSGTLIKAASYD